MYKILYTVSSKEDMKLLPVRDRKVIKKAIETRLTSDPINLGKPLKYDLKGYKRLRVGMYRIIYSINHNEVTIVIVRVDNRKDIYD
jgi:mRNA interferase RelE/StbE